MTQELNIWIKKILILIGFLAVGYVLYLTQSVIGIILIAGFITMLVIPLVDKLEKKKIPAWVTLLGVYAVFILIAIVVIGTIIPIVVTYITDSITSIIKWAQNTQALYNAEGIKAFHLHPYMEKVASYLVNQENMGKIFKMIQDNAGSIQSTLTNQLTNVTSGGINILTNVGGAFFNWILIGGMAFMMTLERKSIGKFIMDVLPDNIEKYLEEHYRDIQSTLNNWIRAMLILSFSIFFLTYVGLTVVELFFGDTGRTFTLALIAGIMEFIPYIGPFIALIPAFIVAVGISWKFGIAIIILYVIIQQLENNVLVPVIMSKSLNLSPVLVFIVMMMGALLGGVVGIILAVPVTAILRILYVNYRKIKVKKQPDLPKMKNNLTKG